MKLTITIFLLTLTVIFSLKAQSDCSLGQFDPSFNIGSGFNSTIEVMVRQSNGRILVGGHFTSYNGNAANYLVRLNSDGSLDNTFNIGSGFNSSVYAVALQPDGKILVGGIFTTFNGTSRNYMVRLNENGSFDNTFNIGTGFSNYVLSMLLQPDSKILVNGGFGSVNGFTSNYIVRLNSNGSVDAGFNPGTNLNGPVNSTVLQSDGKVIIGGTFTSYGPTTTSRIARLNANGTLDPTFSSGSGFNGTVNVIRLQADGKVVAGGNFGSFNGVIRDNIARLNSNGSLDVEFDPGSGFNNDVEDLQVTANGKLLVSGQFTTYFDGTTVNYMARVNPNGSIDYSFSPVGGANSTINSIIESGDGKVLVGGSFTILCGAAANRMGKVGLNVVVGTLSPAAPYCSGQSISIPYLAGIDCFNAGNQFIAQVSLDPSFSDPIEIGRITARGSGIITGNLPQNINGSTYRVRIVSTNPVVFGYNANQSATVLSVNQTSLNLLADPGYSITPGTNVNFQVSPTNAGSNPSYQWFRNSNPVGTNATTYSTSSLSNGDTIICRMLANGCATTSTIRSNPIVMFVSNNQNPGCTGGIRDESFNIGTNINQYIHTIVEQPDGKIIIGGRFTSIGGIARNHIARLNVDGSLDLTFDPGSGFNGDVYSIVLLPDGKIIVGGNFSTFNGTNRNYIVRLTSTGAFDASFNIGSGFNFHVNQLILRPDQRVLVCGAFSTYQGVSRNYIAVLNSNGSLHGSFAPVGSSFNGFPRWMVLQPDYRVVVGGGFTSYNGVGRNRILRLNTDGSLDPSFNPGTGFDGGVETMVLQPDGKIVVGGDFNNFNGTIRNRIARLNQDGTLDAGFDPQGGFNSSVECLALQPEGKIIAGGSFTSYYNTTNINRLVRINKDGSPDGSFSAFGGLNSTPIFLRILNDSRLMVSGYFTAVNGVNQNYLTRLQVGIGITSISPNGPYCPGQALTFNIGAGTNCFNLGNVFTVEICRTPDFSGPVTLGTITARGSTSISANLPASLNGIQYVRVRSSSPIAVSNIFSYNGQILVNNSYVSVKVSPGYLIAAGTPVTFTAVPFNGASNPTYRWFKNGVQVGTGLSYSSSTLVQNDTIYCRMVGTACSSTSILQSTSTIIRIKSATSCLAGGLDASFPGTSTGANNTVNTLKIQPDGRILAGGNFTTFNGTAVGYLTRLSSTGTVETAFNQNALANNSVNAIELEPNGKIWIGGSFSTLNNISRGRIGKLNADGTLDGSVSFASGFNSTVNQILRCRNGEMAVAGSFSSYAGISSASFSRLGIEGQHISSYYLGSNLNGACLALAEQDDGKLFIGGSFTSTLPYIGRFNLDGSVDGSFQIGTGFNGTIRALLVLPDGKLLVGGDFTSFNGSMVGRIVRLFPDGSIDAGFNSGGGGFNNVVRTFALHPSGSILVGGDFTQYNSNTANYILGLNYDGTIDPSFNFGDGFGNAVSSMAFAANGSLLTGGSFSTFNGSSLGRLAKLDNANMVVNSVSPPGPYCANQAIQINFSTGAANCFNSGNTFTAQISNSSGSFSSPVNLGTLTSRGGSALSLTTNIPVLASGSSYRIRITSNNPGLVGSGVSNSFAISSSTPPSVLSVTNNSRCGAGTVVLSAIGSAGSTLFWYADSLATNLLGTGSSFITPIIPTTSTFWVAAGNANCFSLTRRVTATIIPRPTLTNAGFTPNSVCNSGSFTLSATSNPPASEIRWYLDTFAVNSIHVGNTYTTPNLNAPTKYFVESISNGCASFPRTSLNLPVVVPAVTSAIPGSSCSTAAISLQAAGNGLILWYESATGGNPISSGSSPSTFNTTVLSSSKTYYVAVVVGTCTSLTRTPIVATIGNPQILSIRGDSLCSPGGLAQLNATSSTGSQIRWFSQPSGGSVLTTGNNFTTGFLSQNTTFYVEAFSGTCFSQRSAVQVIVSSAPVVSASAQSRCRPGVVSIPSTKTSGIVRWYSSPSAQTPFFIGDTLTQNISQTTTYYIDGIFNKCVSSPRILVTATVVNPIITNAPNQSRCMPGNVTLTATVSGGEIRWFDAINATQPLFTGASYNIPNLQETQTYFAEAFNGACVNPDRSAVTVTVVHPKVDSVLGNKRCLPGAMLLYANANSGFDIRWFSAPSGGTSLTNNNFFMTPNVNASTTFYAEAYNANCANPNRVPVLAEIKPAQNPTVISGSRCGPGQVLLRASAGNDSIRWYTSELGGGAIGYGSNWLTPNLTATTVFWAESYYAGGECFSLLRIPDTAYVRPNPVFTLVKSDRICNPGVCSLSVNVSPANATVFWYTGQNTVNPVHVGNNRQVFISADTTFWLQAVVGQCTTANRVPIFGRISKAPVIVQNISSQTKCSGDSAIFRIRVTGDTLKYQWFKNSLALDGGDSILVVPNVNAVSEGQYRVRITNQLCNTLVNSNVGLLTVVPNPRARIRPFPETLPCVGDTITLEAFTPPQNGVVNWFKDTNPTSVGTGLTFPVSEPGIYHCKYGNNGCFSKLFDEVEIFFRSEKRPRRPVLSLATPPTNCISQFQISNTIPGQGSYQWFSDFGPIPGQNQNTLTISQFGNYRLRHDSLGCISFSQVFSVASPVQAIAQPKINFVTAERMPGLGDTVFWNRVIWGRNQPLNPNVLHTVVYRQGSVTNQYDSVGVVFGADTSFLDSVFVLPLGYANPKAQPHQYKIAARVACSNPTGSTYLTPMSPYHRTIHLIIIKPGPGSTNYNLIWNAYEGFNVASYRIYRGTSPTNGSLLQTVAGNVLSYTDNPGAGNFWYTIDAIALTNDVYQPWGRIAANVPRVTRSNTRPSTQSVVVTDSTASIVRNEIKVKMKENFIVYPNPFQTSFLVKGGEPGVTYKLKLFDAIGREFSQFEYSGGHLEEYFSQMPKGIYFLVIQGQDFFGKVKIKKE